VLRTYTNQFSFSVAAGSKVCVNVPLVYSKIFPESSATNFTFVDRWNIWPLPNIRDHLPEVPGTSSVTSDVFAFSNHSAPMWSTEMPAVFAPV
jgi:hypothetical protein